MQGEAHRSFLSILGWEELEKSVKLFGEKHPFTQLVPNFENMGIFFFSFLFFKNHKINKIKRS